MVNHSVHIWLPDKAKWVCWVAQFCCNLITPPNCLLLYLIILALNFILKCDACHTWLVTMKHNYALHFSKFLEILSVKERAVPLNQLHTSWGLLSDLSHIVGRHKYRTTSHRSHSYLVWISFHPGDCWVSKQVVKLICEIHNIPE